MKSPRQWSVRLRLTIWATAAAALACAVTVGFVLDGNHQARMSDQLREVYSADLRVLHHLARQRAVPPVLPDEGLTAMQVVDPSGRLVSANTRMAGQPRMAFFVPPRRPGGMDGVVCDVPSFPGQCLTVAAMWITTPSGDLIVYGGEPTHPWYGDSAFATVLVSGALIWLILVAVGTHFLVERALRPVVDIASELAEITEKCPGRRVPVPAHHDEIRYLATTANRTLQHLEEAIERERRFTSDVSHDLRTPITGARLRLEEALTDPEVDWPTTARELLNDMERQQALAEDILTLARMGNERLPPQSRADLGQLARREIERRPHGRVPIETDLEPEVIVFCDRLLISRLMANLLDNAQRHAVSRVVVAVRTEDGTGVLVVADDGAGIAPEYRELVFERFARLPESRELDPHGTGLGLAICREIAQAHQGSLNVEDSARGACMVLRLPLQT
ncbi:HAMP domain-containing histidine kinase [Herbidospora galbida]|uniref:histidine kinase n=1 Tax=Herbidospora galbida TaxID=2575442 RepID=A0A4U3M709_9ACTN|nr:HAMP domain-containing sensor histidine kinase [Herbidospora galbida]TKK83754.1 HAMP domain-containing histidine kinase [Herbidospora galbida]